MTYVRGGGGGGGLKRSDSLGNELFALWKFLSQLIMHILFKIHNHIFLNVIAFCTNEGALVTSMYGRVISQRSAHEFPEGGGGEFL